jgi:hypothetical protein
LDSQSALTKVVALDGSGDFKSISEALSKVPDRTLLMIRSGIYKDSLVIGKNCGLVADPPGSVSIVSSSGSAISISAGIVTLSGIVVAFEPASSSVTGPSIQVTGGRLSMETCSVTSHSLACVDISGKSTEGTLFGCSIGAGAHGGLFVHDGAVARADHCVVSANSIGIGVVDEARILVMGCTITGMQQLGILAKRAYLTVDGSTAIHDNLGSGIKATGGSRVKLVNAQIRANKGWGIQSLENSLIQIGVVDLNANIQGDQHMESGGTIRDDTGLAGGVGTGNDSKK